jgi:hypothetical protein
MAMKNALRIAALLLAAAGSMASAQSTERPKPPGTKPLEELPPPPALPPVSPGDAQNLGEEPQVTVRKEGPNTIEEYRLHGKLYMMKVTPAHGRAYVLMDNKGDGTFTRQDNPLDQGIRVPQWVLWEF